MDRNDAVLILCLGAPLMVVSGLIVANVIATPIMVLVGLVMFYAGLALF